MRYGLLLLLVFLCVAPLIGVYAVKTSLHSGLQAERYEAATRHRVDATVVNVKPLHSGREVTVAWTDQNGTPHKGRFTTWRGVDVGDRPEVWVGGGEIGEYPPRTHAQTIGDAAAVGASTVAATGLPLLGLYLLLRRRFDQRRYRMWDEAWAGFDRRRIGP